ncbi:MULTISPECIES: hypothetical protein [unclassified Knoellia]|uniref:hypothetical protein n=1 Tax=Knoellia altitudinis TaxID=3404795 RepID=UPI00361DDE1F
MTEQREDRRVSRRTIAKGAAWAIPAVPLVVATPAYAESGGGPTGLFLGACKQPGNSCFSRFGFRKGYTFTFRITNTTDQTIYVYPTLNNVDNPDSANPSHTLNPVFSLVSNPAKTFSYNTARRFTGGAIGVPLQPAEAILPGQSLDIIVNADASGNSANISALGSVYIAWGHTPVIGGDPDHPYVPVPPANPAGEGWIRIPIQFGSTPPCGTDCGPGGDESETGN